MNGPHPDYPVESREPYDIDDEAESEFIARAVVFACVVLAGIVMLSARMGWF